MVRNIVRLLSEEQRRRGVWVVFSVLTRAILDFAGIAALVPILLIVVKDGGRSMMLAVCGVVLLFVLLKNTLVMLLAHVQSCYQLEIYREFSTRMFANYYHRGLLYLKGKSSLMIFDRHANLKYKYGNRHFWCRGYYVDTVGKNAKKIEEYVRNQMQQDLEYDQMSLKEYIDPFTGEPVNKA